MRTATLTVLTSRNNGNRSYNNKTVTIIGARATCAAVRATATET
jgi:hypothetical protein